MKRRKLPTMSDLASKCKCKHAIQPGETRVKLKGAYDKCHTCFLKDELK